MNVPSFMVRVDSQKHIDFALNSPFGGGRPGRVKRKNAKYALSPKKRRHSKNLNALARVPRLQFSRVVPHYIQNRKDLSTTQDSLARVWSSNLGSERC